VTNYVFQASDADEHEKGGSASSFLNEVNRGALTAPSELSFLICVQLWKIFKHISMSHEQTQLLYTENLSSCSIFKSVSLMYFSTNDESRLVFIHQECGHSHSLQDHTKLFSSKIFNLFSKNYSSFLNSQIHSKRGHKSQKRDPTFSKVAKLQSSSSV